MKQRKLFAILLIAILPVSTWADNTFAERFGKFRTNDSRQWRHTAANSIHNRSKRVTAGNAPVTDADITLPAAGNWGLLTGTDGTIWTYTMSYEYEKDDKGKNTDYYSGVTIHIYDSENKQVGEIIDVFDTSTEKINAVEVNPLITKSFFNLASADYEIMIFVHGVTGAPDYKTHSYNNVYSIGNPDKICTMEGNQVLAENMATDPWSEAYTMVFERESSTDTQYFLHYDIYTKATYASPEAPVCVHTFDVDYSYVAGSGNESLPILMAKQNNTLYFALAQYEKPYFIYSDNWLEEPTISPDNNFVITLYDNTFTQQSVTKIPVPYGGEYLYSFPTIGGLRYTDDLTFGLFTQDSEPTYIITFDNYTSIEDFTSSFYAYNTAGERIATIAENAGGALKMSDVAGHPEQYCFLIENEEEAWFCFVDLPSCQEVTRIPIVLENRRLSMNLDRYVAGHSYQYAISVSQGISDKEDNTIHSIAWLNTNGSLDHYDNLNLGKDIAMAQIYMNADAFNPWIFNTDDDREYMALVKRYQKVGSTATDEVLYVVNTKGDRLLEYGPSAEKGGALLNIILYNYTTAPTLLCAYANADWQYTLHFTRLPLSKFPAGGNGTADNPYLISTAGDFWQIDTQPMAYYQIINDIDFKNISWSGIKNTFSGSLDGGNYALTNLALDGNGLFTYISNAATVKDMQIYQPSLVLSGRTHVAGIIANNITGGINGSGAGTPSLISNVHIYKPTVVAGTNFDDEFGGIVGIASLYTQIKQCSVSEADFNIPKGYIGGIVGRTRTSSAVTACSFSGNIKGNVVGGIIATNNSANETVTHCHSNGCLVGNTVGGIIGESERAGISNCYAEGVIALNENADKGCIGGIAGYLASNDTESTDNVINNCLIGISTVNIPATATNTYAHRVVGFSNIDTHEIDWDNTTDWNNPVYLESLPETAIANNYVISALAPIDTEIEGAHNTTEGATLPAGELTSDFLTAHNFLAGSDVEAPWIHDNTPYLWYEKEAGSLLVSPAELTLLTDATATVVFTILNGDAAQINITVAEPCVEMMHTEVIGDQLEVTVWAKSEGKAVLTATYGDKTATCLITCINETAVDNIRQEPFFIHYNGTAVTADEAAVNIYSMNGSLVRKGYGTVYTQGLPDGIYIVYAVGNRGTATRKIIVK